MVKILSSYQLPISNRYCYSNWNNNNGSSNGNSKIVKSVRIITVIDINNKVRYMITVPMELVMSMIMEFVYFNFC